MTFDLNEMFINKGGYDWIRYKRYKDFIIFKDKDIEYFQMRKSDGTYLFNFRNLEEGIDAVNKVYYKEGSNVKKHPFVEGESYYLLNCGLPCEMVFMEETDDDFVFMDGMSIWGGCKEEILELFERGQLTQDKDLIQKQIDYIKTCR